MSYYGFPKKQSLRWKAYILQLYWGMWSQGGEVRDNWHEARKEAEPLGVTDFCIYRTVLNKQNTLSLIESLQYIQGEKGIDGFIQHLFSCTFMLSVYQSCTSLAWTGNPWGRRQEGYSKSWAEVWPGWSPCIVRCLRSSWNKSERPQGPGVMHGWWLIHFPACFSSAKLSWLFLILHVQYKF